jgi:hypothetical protein
MLFSECKGCKEKPSIQQQQQTLSAEPESAESQEPEVQAAPDPTAETKALADINRALKRKLSEAVRVANVCHRALERGKGCNRSMEGGLDEADETVRKLKWALLIQREAYQRIRCNPCGVPQGPTPAEVQERMAEEKKKREKGAQEAGPIRAW